MSRSSYRSPVFLDANGTITLTVSQLAALGLKDPAEWEEYWADAKDACVYDGFDVNDPESWPDGFILADSSTWDILIGF